MPTELLKEYIGKECIVITLEPSGFETQGTLVAVEGNWVKVQRKKNLRIINGDMITEIIIVPEKEQKSK